MIRSKLGLKALGLCALVVGLMAVSAGVAQAEEPGGAWTFLNVQGKELLELPNNETIGGRLDCTSGTLLTEIAKTKVGFTCESFKATGAKLIKGGTALGLLVFEKCFTTLNGTKSAACEPKAGGTEKGVIKTLELEGRLLLHKLKEKPTDKVFIVEPDVAAGANSFAHIELSEECSIGENVLIFGPFAFIDCLGHGEVHEVEHLVTEFEPLTKIWAISNTAEHAARIDGSAFVFLTGANIGKEWAAL